MFSFLTFTTSTSGICPQQKYNALHFKVYLTLQSIAQKQIIRTIKKQEHILRVRAILSLR